MKDLQTVLAGRSQVQWLGLIVGGAFVVTGLLGFAVTGFDNFAAHEFDEKFLGLPVNPLHNLFHLVGGLIAVLASRRHVAIKRTAQILAGVFLVSFVAGITGQLKYLAIEGATSPDNWLHLVVGLVALYYGTMGSGEAKPVPAPAKA